MTLLTSARTSATLCFWAMRTGPAAASVTFGSTPATTTERVGSPAELHGLGLVGVGGQQLVVLIGDRAGGVEPGEWAGAVGIDENYLAIHREGVDQIQRSLRRGSWMRNSTSHLVEIDPPVVEFLADL